MKNSTKARQTPEGGARLLRDGFDKDGFDRDGLDRVDHAEDFLRNELRLDHTNSGGVFYSSDEPARVRKLNNNFQKTQQHDKPTMEERNCVRFGVHLWSNIEAGRPLPAQVAREMRKMAKFLTDKAEEVLRLGREVGK